MTDKQQLLALAERCEQATGPDGMLDRAIREAKVVPETRALRRYTSSLDAALKLVPEGWDRGVVTRRGRASAYVNNGQSHFVGVAATPNPNKLWFECCAATEALALCAAALRARAAQETDNG